MAENQLDLEALAKDLNEAGYKAYTESEPRYLVVYAEREGKEKPVLIASITPIWREDGVTRGPLELTIPGLFFEEFDAIRIIDRHLVAAGIA